MLRSLRVCFSLSQNIEIISLVVELLFCLPAGTLPRRATGEAGAGAH